MFNRHLRAAKPWTSWKSSVSIRFAILLPVLLLMDRGAFAQDGANAQKALRTGERLLHFGSAADAVEAFTLSIQVSPRQPEAYRLRGDALRHLGRLREAINDYSAAIALGGDRADCLARRANAWGALKDYPRAMADCEAALELQPDHLEALSVRADLREAMGDIPGAVEDKKRIALWSGNWERSYVRLAHGYFRSKEYRQALTAYDRILLADPGHGEALHWSAVTAIELDDDAEAVRRITDLLKADPGQSGGYVRQRPFARKLTEVDLAHGRKEVDRLLKDRPALTRFVTQGGAVFDWIVRKFAGEDLSERIVWDANEPAFGDACHIAPRGGRPARIWLRSTNASANGLGPIQAAEAGETLLTRLVFELHNVQSYAHFEQLNNLAAAGHLTGEGYVLENARLEFYALQRMRAWYLDVCRPWCLQHRIPTNCRIWFEPVPLTFDDFMRMYSDRKEYPWVPYAAQYEGAVRAKKEM